MKIMDSIIMVKSLREFLDCMGDEDLLLVSIEPIDGNPVEWMKERWLVKKEGDV